MSDRVNECNDELNSSIIEYGFESRMQSPSSNLTPINSCERNELIAGQIGTGRSAIIFETYRNYTILHQVHFHS